MKKYQYESLHYEGEIRVLRVSRSHFPRPRALSFSLQRVLLSQNPTYEALSYVWGSSERCKAIKNSDTRKTLSITENCFSALYDLCYDGSRQLFVDQVCIDQDNVDERNQQVALMAQIYEQASRTIIYLGGPDIPSDYIMEYRRLGNYNEASDEFEAGLTQSFFDAPFIDEYYGESALSRDLLVLASRPWFKRTWTIQESLLAPENIVCIGNREIEWNFLVREIKSRWPISASKEFNRPREISLFYGRDITLESNLWVSEPSYAQEDGRLPYEALFKLMCRTAECECADPRDKLFALMSLFHGDPPRELKPDYSRSVWEVYAGVTRYAFENLDRSEPYDIVLTKATGITEPTSSLPTWVIDWRRLSPYWKVIDDRAESAGHTSHVNGYHKGLCLNFTTNDHLKVHGIRLGRVESVTLDAYQYKDIMGPEGPYGLIISFSIELSNLESRSMYALPTSKPVQTKARRETCVGDHVCLFVGFTLPYILRENGSTWKLVGECWPWNWYYDRGLFDEDPLVATLMKEPRTASARWATRKPIESPLLSYEDFEII